MPIRSTNGYFNSPQFAAAASNLTALFEPPSGADAAGWADANAKKAAASRIQQLFDYRNAPDFNQQSFDRGNIAVGNYAPTSSYQAQDQNDATKRRGDDITAATSRANNTADNSRALEVGRIGGLANLYRPLDQGQIRPELPQDAAQHFGIAAAPQVAGAPKPQSETEVQGGLVQQMRDAGLITDQQVADRYNGDKTPVEAVGADGKPAYMSPGAAVRTGAAPYSAPKGNGTTMTLADGTTVQIGGDKPPSEAQGKLVNYGATAEQMLPMLDKMGGALTDIVGNGSTHVPGGYGNYLQSEEYQNARIVGQRFVQSILRNESGAATPKEEIANYSETLLPQPGDKPGTVRLKTYLRKVAVEAMKGGMGLQARQNAIDAALAAGPPPEGTTDRVAPATATAPNGASAASSTAAPPVVGPSQKAIDYLQANPATASLFDAKYGAGASARALGGR